jgi:hypothetical protein
MCLICWTATAAVQWLAIPALTLTPSESEDKTPSIFTACIWRSPSWPILKNPWRWRRYVRPKRWAVSDLHGVKTQKAILLIVLAKRTSKQHEGHIVRCCMRVMMDLHHEITSTRWVPHLFPGRRPDVPHQTIRTPFRASARIAGISDRTWICMPLPPQTSSRVSIRTFVPSEQFLSMSRIFTAWVLHLTQLHGFEDIRGRISK